MVRIVLHDLQKLARGLITSRMLVIFRTKGGPLEDPDVYPCGRCVPSEEA